jgi:hypothetical protein
MQAIINSTIYKQQREILLQEIALFLLFVEYVVYLLNYLTMLSVEIKSVVPVKIQKPVKNCT